MIFAMNVPGSLMLTDADVLHEEQAEEQVAEAPAEQPEEQVTETAAVDAAEPLYHAGGLEDPIGQRDQWIQTLAKMDAKQAFDEAVADAEQRLIEANLSEDRLKGLLKAAKAERQECLDHLVEINAQGVEAHMSLAIEARTIEWEATYGEEMERLEEEAVNAFMAPRAEELREQLREEREEKLASASKVPTDVALPELAPPPVPSDAWRAIPTRDVLAGIPRLGAKKLELLTDAMPTLGDVEDIRERASRAHKQFAEELPKGIGPDLADRIEDAILDAISKHARRQ